MASQNRKHKMAWMKYTWVHGFKHQFSFIDSPKNREKQIAMAENMRWVVEYEISEKKFPKVKSCE